MYRVTIQKSEWTKDIESREELELKHEVQSEDPIVVAQFLRAVADRLDPPKSVHRTMETRSSAPATWTDG